ncbi:MAG: hypothetical protein IJH53_03120 [Oscillospiraceae bacterium]|nr:hypothetical protein [Oscillospiraceae bacterium]
MKRTIAFILLLGMLAALSGCGILPSQISPSGKRPAVPEPARTASPVPAATPAAEPAPEETAPAEVQPEQYVFSEEKAKAEKVYEGDGIEITRYDFSLYDGKDVMLVELWYDLVQLSGEPYRYVGVNDELRKGLADYVYSLNNSFVQDTISYAEELKASAETEGWGWVAFTNTVSADVKEFDEDIFSAALFTDWYMGGVHNIDAECVNYDLQTGMPITLEKIASTLGSGTDLTEFIRAKANAATVEREMEPKYPTDLRLEDLEFYVENRELVIYFNTYQIGYGADGSFPAPTGIFLGGEQGAAADVRGRTWRSEYTLQNYSLPVFSWTEEENAGFDTSSCVLSRELTLGTDGSFTALGADNGFGQRSSVTGTFSFDESGSTVSFSYTDTNGRQQNASYALARIGDCIQLTQLGADLFGYGSPVLTVFTMEG